MLRRRMPMLADAHISSLGYLWLYNSYESYHLSGPPLSVTEWWVLDNPKEMVSPYTKLQLLAKVKKTGGEGSYQKERLGEEAPLGTLKMSFLFLRFLTI